MCTFAAAEKSLQGWLMAPREKEALINNHNRNGDTMSKLTSLPNAALSTFHLNLTTAAWFYTFQWGNWGTWRDSVTCSNLNTSYKRTLESIWTGAWSKLRWSAWLQLQLVIPACCQCRLREQQWRRSDWVLVTYTETRVISQLLVSIPRVLVAFNWS